MPLTVFLLYLGTWFLVALTPGPAAMCSMAMATRHGFRSSLVGIAGIQTGNAIFFGCVALGLGTLLAAATTVFEFLRIAGALYLFWMGLRIIWTTFRKRAAETQIVSVQPAVHRNLFLQGLLIQLTNPKALLFVSALLPQFINPDVSAGWQLTILLVTTIIVDLLVLSSYAFAAHRGAHSLRQSRLKVWLERLLGAAMLFFGLRLLVSSRK